MFYRFSKVYPDHLLVLPKEILDHLKEASDGEVRILLMSLPLLSQGAKEEDILSALEEDFSRDEIFSALAFWRGCGVLTRNGKGEKKEKSKPVEKETETKEKSSPETEEEKEEKKVIDADEAPFYSSADLAEARNSKPDFKNLVDFAEERLEKVMNVSEYARLYSFLDYLKMPLDVVLLVIEDCASRGKKSLRYITKILTSFQDDGIDTYDKAEEYFIRRNERNEYESFVRSLFGLGTRKLTRAEEECLDLWQKKYGYGEDILTAAFEKTANTAKNPSIKYMHKILESWHESGVTSPEDIDKIKPKNGEGAPKSYDLDDFFEQAVSVGRKKL